MGRGEGGLWPGRLDHGEVGGFKQMKIRSEGVGKPLQFEAGPIPDLSVSRQQVWSTPRTSCLAGGAWELCGTSPVCAYVFL